jgi:chromosome segregation ATPase
MMQVRTLYAATAMVLALACGARSRAAAEAPGGAEQKPADHKVRKLGGDHGADVELAPAPEPKRAPAMDMPAGSEEALEEARHKARDAMKEAREAMRNVPQDTHQALEQARQAMKEAHEQAREAMEKVPEEARREMEQARAQMQKAHEQGKEALDEAKAAMDKARAQVDKAREQMKQALPGLPGTASQKDQARYARRVAWHALMNRVQKPSDVPPAAREELRHHAQRMAKLQRIHALAASKADKATIARCDKLLVREQARHQQKIAALLPQGQAAAKPAPEPDDEDQNEGDNPDDEEQEAEP